VQVPDLELGFEVDLVIIFRAQTILAGRSKQVEKEFVA
jgi:hypothetical protein